LTLRVSIPGSGLMGGKLGTPREAAPRASKLVRIAALWRRALACVAVALAIAAPAADAEAEELQGRVVAIRDGDTLELVTAERTRHRVRLAGIDAPETGQPYGNAAKRALSALTYRQPVHVAWAKHDDYGRIVGTVYVRAPTSACG
jgi:endonuclease YncB( thermonuclease family)